jgi:hypothetical protein
MTFDPGIFTANTIRIQMPPSGKWRGLLKEVARMISSTDDRGTNKKGREMMKKEEHEK